MAAIQVNVRFPEVLLARIDSEAGDGNRSQWILESCRMRLNKLGSGEESQTHQTAGVGSRASGPVLMCPAACMVRSSALGDH